LDSRQTATSGITFGDEAAKYRARQLGAKRLAVKQAEDWLGLPIGAVVVRRMAPCRDLCALDGEAR
jgi:hypothetical protein